MQDLNIYWEKCLNIMRLELGEIPFKTWIEPLKPVNIKDNEIILLAVEDVIEDFVNKKYLGVLERIISQVIGEKIKVKVIKEDNFVKPESFSQNKSNVDSSIDKENNLNNDYIFKTFVVGESNRMAHAASVAVAENPGKSYNPLFLYGDVGLGKTHLMQAVAHYILEQNPNSKVLYASCEKFTNELITSIKEDKNKKFREKYRKIDVLLIDDIQFITDKTQTQEEFFHTFNDLKESGKQIIISSDRPPNEIKTLTERLRSRFSGGLIADIKTPNFETRTAILEKKAESLKVNLPKEVSQFIAQSVKSNIRELEGALTRVLAYADLTSSKLTIEIAEDALKDLIQDTGTKLNIDLIQEVVAKHFNIKVEEIKTKKRTQPVAYARQISMYLARQILNDSLKSIGNEFGRDHSTVIHAIAKTEKEMQTNEDTKSLINQLIASITKK